MTRAGAIPALAAVLVLLAALPTAAVTCRDIVFDDTPYTICEADPAREDLRLFLRNEDGDILGQFNRVDAALERHGQTLAFAMNAGMFHPDRRPVGHYVEDGREIQAVIAGAGPGNFGMVPNGVFCIGDRQAWVFETTLYLSARPDCLYATQSGPMLVIDGELHPRFLPDSTSRYLRNGVGTTDRGDRVVFAISNRPVTFHQFGRLFRDRLDLRQALYFDGNISRLYAPAIGRHDPGFPVGPIVGIVTPR